MEATARAARTDAGRGRLSAGGEGNVRAATAESIRHFYIPEEQSIYLLSKDEAHRLKAWVQLCQDQLKGLGYRQVALLGKGAYSFVFTGRRSEGAFQVFKFSRITLPQHVQDRLEEEAYMLSRIEHPNVPHSSPTNGSVTSASWSWNAPRARTWTPCPSATGHCRCGSCCSSPDSWRRCCTICAITLVGPSSTRIKPFNLVFDPEDGRASLNRLGVVGLRPGGPSRPAHRVGGIRR
ncbi:MAG: hypothetical protein U5L11_06825 [Arhodomonas sp.]|nr:hypothetical protein [Arhodomonas sp.]